VFSLRRHGNSKRFTLHVTNLGEQQRSGVTLALQLPKPRQCRVFPNSIKLKQAWTNGRLEITLGALDVHAAILIDCE